jgi:hypothetical protein
MRLARSALQTPLAFQLRTYQITQLPSFRTESCLQRSASKILATGGTTA